MKNKVKVTQKGNVYTINVATIKCAVGAVAQHADYGFVSVRAATGFERKVIYQKPGCTIDRIATVRVHSLIELRPSADISETDHLIAQIYGGLSILEMERAASIDL